MANDGGGDPECSKAGMHRAFFVDNDAGKGDAGTGGLVFLGVAGDPAMPGI